MFTSHLEEIHIYGIYKEFLIGTISDKENKRIIDNGENLEKVFNSMNELDDCVHLFSASLEDVCINDKNEENIDLKKWIINYEPCYENINKEILIESFQNMNRP